MRLVGLPVFLAKVVGKGLGLECVGGSRFGCLEPTLRGAPFGEDVGDRTRRFVDRRRRRHLEAAVDGGVAGLGQVTLVRARIQQASCDGFHALGQLHEPWIAWLECSLLRLDGTQDIEVPDEAVGRGAQVFGGVSQFDLGM